MRPAVGRLIRTLAPLKPEQLFGRAVHEIRLRAFRNIPSLLPSLLGNVVEDPKVEARLSFQAQPEHRKVEADRILNENKMLLAGHDVTATDWNNQSLPKLVRYHLHYLDAARSLAECQHVSAALKLVDGWAREHPPSGGEAWEPYAVSVRLQNLCRIAGLAGAVPSSLSRLILLHARYVRMFPEVHLHGNHLLKNVCALWMAGLLLSGQEAAAMCDEGAVRVKEELERQILPDGGHEERSPMYHLLVLSDLLDIQELARARKMDFPWLRQVIDKMAAFTAKTLHPDGDIALFNDSVLGQAPLPAEIFARLGQVPQSDSAPISDFPRFGLTVLRPSVEEAVLFDSGALGPEHQSGHAHSDTLSYELSVAGERRVVNGGVDGYQSRHRAFFRSATAHNTLTVDGDGPDELWSAFRVGGRNTVLRREAKTVGKFLCVTAEMEAFQGWTHKRYGILLPSNFWLVCDEVKADNAVFVVSRARFLPGKASLKFVPLLGKAENRKSGYAPSFGPIYDIEENSVVGQGSHVRLAYACVFGETPFLLEWAGEFPTLRVGDQTLLFT